MHEKRDRPPLQNLRGVFAHAVSRPKRQIQCCQLSLKFYRPFSNLFLWGKLWVKFIKINLSSHLESNSQPPALGSELWYDCFHTLKKKIKNKRMKNRIQWTGGLQISPPFPFANSVSCFQLPNAIAIFCQHVNNQHRYQQTKTENTLENTTWQVKNGKSWILTLNLPT